MPLLAVIENVLAWERDPSEDRRVRVSDALATAATTVGVTGGWLHTDAIGGTPLDVAWGSQANVPGPPDDAIALHAVDHTPIGLLWLAGATSDPTPIIRGIELALDAAWARDEMRQTAERLEALDAATRGIAGVLSLDRVLQLIADRVRELIGAEYAALGIVGELGIIERFVTSGISREERLRIGALPRGHGLLGLIVRENRTIRVPDIARHPASSGFPPHHPPMTSFLGVPIQVKGRSVGNFYLTNKRGATAFSAADEHLVEMFALHAGVAIENARLHEQVQRMAVVDERTRIGKDLHDGIIQALYGVGLSLEDVPDMMRDEPDEAVARVDRAIDSLNLTIRDLRNFIFGLRPELVEQGDLVAGVGALVNEFRLNTVIDVDFSVSDEAPDLDADRRAEALQILREALSNAARHSHATRASIEMGGSATMLRIVVADNGRGFEPAAERDDSHQGLLNMRARAERLGGRLTVTSAVGQGTQVEMELPTDVAMAEEH
jgi:signal transduction histidine kinase